MRKIYGKITAWILAAGLAVGLLSGCQKREVNKIQESTASIGVNGQGPISGHEPENSGALGRYGETQMELPEEIKEQSLCQFIRGTGGDLELFTMNRDSSGTVTKVFHYRYQNGAWEKEENWQGEQILKDRSLDLSLVTYGMDKGCYIGGTDQEYQFHLFKLKEDGTATELLEEVFKPKDGSSYGLIPPKVEVLENGNLLIYGYWDLSLYDPSGVLLYTFAKDFSGSTSEARGFCEGEELVTVQEDQLVRYNLKNGKVLEAIAWEEIKGSRETVILFGDGNGGIYAANETGLSHINKGGTLWEILMDGSLNHMGMRSLFLQQFLQGDQGDFYGAFTSEGGSGIQIFHYAYDQDLSSVPPSGLTVYSLTDNSTVRQAASQFQSEHPDIRVEVRTATEKDGTVTEEMIQGLNTELLSGKGADVLILDGLPVDSYIEKGILMDLSSLVSEMETSEEMLNNLLEGFRQEDGAIYQVPARIEIPVLLGEDKAIAAYSSLETMAGYEGERPLVPIAIYENLLRMTARLQYEELFINGKGLADRDTLIRYLETVRVVGEASNSKNSFTEEEGKTYWVSNHVLPSGIRDSAIQYDAGHCDSGIASFGCFMDLCIPVEVRNHSDKTRMVSVGKIYLPLTLTGINRSTANEDMAKEFVRCLLSFEVQKEELYDGFPVNKKALETITEREKESWSVGSSAGDGSYEIHADWPDLETRREVASMIEALTIPAVVDETMMNMIVEGSRGYYDNKENVEAAADKILRKLSIYLAE